MINLIPKHAKKDVKLEYWLRVATAWAYLWAATLVVSIVILVPTYVLITMQVSAHKASADSAEKVVTDFANVSSDLMQAGRQAAQILNDAEQNEMHEYVSLFESLQGTGITIASLQLSREAGVMVPVTITGQADSREDLAGFRDRLLAHQAVAEVDLPISNLAKDSDIQYTLTVTLINEVAL